MKTPLAGAREETGSLPAMTGARLRIKKCEKTKTKETAQTPLATMYVVTLAVLEPKGFKGQQVRDYIVTGSEDNKAWDENSRGVSRIKRLLTRSGTPITDDDEEWMEAMCGNEVVAPISVTEGQRGTMNNVGLYYRPTDDDAPQIGLAEEKKGGGGAAGASKKAKAVVAQAEATDDDDADEDAPQPKANVKAAVAASGKGNKGTKPDPDDDDDD